MMATEQQVNELWDDIADACGVTPKGHLDGLSPEQLAGYESFARWMDGARPIAVLEGAGGTGKTYSVARWCQQYGLHQSQVFGIAPTNAARTVLRNSLREAGFPCNVTTIHRALGLSPDKPSWGAEDDLLLQTAIATLATAEQGDDQLAIAKAAAEVNKLTSRLKAFREGKLIFKLPKDGSPMAGDHPYRLFVLDEASMVASELDALVNDILLNENCKILKMGDSLQLFPVGEGLSPALQAPAVAVFEDIRRCKSALRELNIKVRSLAPNAGNTYHVLRNLPHWSVYAQSPNEVPDNTPVSISRHEAKVLFAEWANNCQRDGLEFRYLAYTNATVDKINAASLAMAGLDACEIGDHIVATSPVERWHPEKSFTLLTNGERVEIRDRYHPYQAYVPGYPSIAVHQFIVPNWDQDDVFDDRRFLVGHPYYDRLTSFLGASESGLVRECSPVKWTNDKHYWEALEFWRNVKNAMYSKKPPAPSANPSVARFFEMLGIESWTQIQGTPGYSRFKPEAGINLDLFLEGATRRNIDSFRNDVTDDNGNICFEIGKGKYSRGLRKQVHKLYKWLESGVVDPVKPTSASTVYRSQGSTIDHVLLDLEDIYSSRFHGDTGGENCYRALYTAVSRAKKRLFVIV